MIKQLTVITIIILVLLFAISSIFITDRERQDGCKELGYDSYTMINGMSYCQDSELNLHLANWEYDGFLSIKVKEINIYERDDLE